MVFSSPTFLFLFLPAVLLGVALLQGRLLTNTWLLGMSLLFYVWGAGAAVVILGYVTVISFAAGLLPWVRFQERSTVLYRALLGTSIALLLVPLLFYKYLPPLASWFGSDVFAAITLPLGISFFTFHGISYVVDRATGSVGAERNPLDFALYLFVFPHQIAGPIVRYTEIRAELKRDRRPQLDEVGYGFTRFAWGLAKKAVVADPTGQLATALYAQDATGATLSAADAWAAALLYAFQIYFDFSAYSDMAIGLALILGFRFPENFAQPYRSHSVTEFWRRWHMTLSRWFRDYVYIPMGGNRRGPRRAVLALLTTFLLTSLWHGAGPTFLLWGGMHSAMLLLERWTGIRSSPVLRGLRRVGTFLFIVVSWVPFRSTSIDQTLSIWGSMFAPATWAPGPTLLTGLTPLVVVAVTVGFVSLIGPQSATGFGTVFGTREFGDERFRWRVAVPGAVALAAVAITTVLWFDFSPFLYFQF